MPSGGKRPGTGPKSKAEKAVIAAISIKDAARFSTMFGKVMTKPVEAAKGARAMVEAATPTGGAAATAAGAAVPGRILPQISEEPNMTRKRDPGSWRAGERIDGASMTSSADAPLQARQKVEDLIMRAQVAHRDLANSEDNQVQAHPNINMAELRNKVTILEAALDTALNALEEQARSASDAATSAACDREPLLSPWSLPFWIAQQPGKGSCLYESLADQLVVTHGGPRPSASDVRGELALFLETNPGLLVAGVPLSQWVCESEGLSVPAYAAQARRHATWGGALELAAAACCYSSSVDVYERAGSNGLRHISCFEPPGAPPKARLALLYVSRCHYDSIRFDSAPCGAVGAGRTSAASATNAVERAVSAVGGTNGAMAGSSTGATAAVGTLAGLSLPSSLPHAPRYACGHCHADLRPLSADERRRHERDCLLGCPPCQTPSSATVPPSGRSRSLSPCQLPPLPTRAPPGSVGSSFESSLSNDGSALPNASSPLKQPESVEAAAAPVASPGFTGYPYSQASSSIVDMDEEDFWDHCHEGGEDVADYSANSEAPAHMASQPAVVSLQDLGGFSQPSDLLSASQAELPSSSCSTDGSSSQDRWGLGAVYETSTSLDHQEEVENHDSVAAFDDVCIGEGDGGSDFGNCDGSDGGVSSQSGSRNFSLRLHDITSQRSALVIVDKEPFTITIRAAIQAANFGAHAFHTTHYGRICCLDTHISMDQHGEAWGLPSVQITLEDVSDRIIDLDLFESTIVHLHRLPEAATNIPATAPKEDCWKASEDAAEIPIPELTGAQLQLVADALSTEGGVVMNEIRNIPITVHDLKCLQPQQWLNDEVVNAIIELINSAKTNYSRHCYHVMNSNFFAKLVEGGTPNHLKVARWTKGINVFALDRLCIPIHLNQNHWALAVINMAEECFEYFDSLGGDGHQVMECLAVWLRGESIDKRKVSIVAALPRCRHRLRLSMDARTARAGARVGLVGSVVGTPGDFRGRPGPRLAA
jgi:hypothetical protein